MDIYLTLGVSHESPRYVNTLGGLNAARGFKHGMVRCGRDRLYLFIYAPSQPGTGL